MRGKRNPAPHIVGMGITDFELDVLYNVMAGTTTPKVVDSRGHTPLIACLDSETVGILLERIEKAGGCGTVYALSDNGEVNIVAVQDVDPAGLEANTLNDGSPIRELIGYVSAQDDWVHLAGVKMRSYGTTTLSISKVVPGTNGIV